MKQIESKYMFSVVALFPVLSGTSTSFQHNMIPVNSTCCDSVKFKENWICSESTVFLQACVKQMTERRDSSAISIPTVEKFGHQLLFCDGCDFTELKLLSVDERDNYAVKFRMKVEHGTKVVSIPTTFIGEYELQLDYKDWFLWGIVTF
ncbi:MAG: hypothetical protein J6I52_02690 [Prevotella sp.]|nr:hypothetical protein [Prevotella sp.]